jgi:hypothetical protein
MARKFHTFSLPISDHQLASWLPRAEPNNTDAAATDAIHFISHQNPTISRNSS